MLFSHQRSMTVFASLATLYSAVQATRFNVNSGCVLVNSNIAVCSGKGPIEILGGSASVLACFDGQNQCSTTANSYCSLSASWPVGYGDVFLGGDLCLYDASGNKINKECASGGTSPNVGNPYNAWYGC